MGTVFMLYDVGRIGEYLRIIPRNRKRKHSARLGFDIDAGPIMFELSPSGTAFTAGAATYFNDTAVRNDILTTAEIAGHTIRHNGKRHYILANIALVGESIMLAMRSHFR